jgi:hypothetical protein
MDLTRIYNSPVYVSPAVLDLLEQEDDTDDAMWVLVYMSATSRERLHSATDCEFQCSLAGAFRRFRARADEGRITITRA